MPEPLHLTESRTVIRALGRAIVFTGVAGICIAILAAVCWATFGERFLRVCVFMCLPIGAAIVFATIVAALSKVLDFEDPAAALLPLVLGVVVWCVLLPTIGSQSEFGYLWAIVLAPPTLATLVVYGLALSAAFREARGKAIGFCPICGYEMRDAKVCPECGRAAPTETASSDQ